MFRSKSKDQRYKFETEKHLEIVGQIQDTLVHSLLLLVHILLNLLT